MTAKVIGITGLCFLVMAGILQSEEIYELDLRRPREIEGGPSPALAAAAGGQTEVLDFRAQVLFLPDSSRLVCRTDLVLKRLRRGNEPLLLYFDAQKMETRMDSVGSIIGVDSVEIYSDAMLIFQGVVEAGQIDTLTFWFANRADFRGRKQSYPMIDTLYSSYYGLYYWSPFPIESSFSGGFKVSFDITAPKDYFAVSQGELQRTWEPSPGLTCYEWRTPYPAKDAPIFIVDTYRVKHYERNGMRFNIYHRDSPDSLLDARAEWYFEERIKYENWFGGMDYRTINMVELVQWNNQAPYFSVPGTFFVPSGHLGGQNYTPGNTPYYMRKLQAHELAHQWWGHRVWSPEHYYMTEGWAEYSALRAVPQDINELKKRYRNNLQRALRLRLDTETDRPLVEEPPVGDTALFYLKGPWVLYMLECLLGEETFLAGLREYQSGYAYRENTLSDFFSILERNSGRDLSWFRREWYEKAGYPQVTMRQFFSGKGSGLIGQTVLEQSGGLFDIPVELGVFSHGQVDPEIIEVRLRRAVDTLDLPLDAFPDSVRLDPLVKTLVDVVYPPSMSLAPLGVAPAGQNCRLDLYLDSTKIFRDVSLFFKSGGSGWDSVRVQSPDLPGGFLGVDLPPHSDGLSVDYYVRVINESGLEFHLPAGAPESPAGVEFRDLPRAGRRALATFEPWEIDYSNTEPPGEEPFPAHGSGMLCFNPEDLSVFGILYGAGNLAPAVDSEQKFFYSYNWFTGTVDVVDLNAWKIIRKMKIPSDSRGIEIGYNSHLYGILDETRNAYYLLDLDCLYRVDLTTGAFKVIAGHEGGNSFAGFPRQFEVIPEKNLLLMKTGYNVRFHDRDSGEFLREIPMSGYNEFPHLLDDGTLLTAELYHNLQDYIEGRTVRHHLIVRRYDISGDKPVLIDSTHSRELDFSMRLPYPTGTGSTRFLNRGRTLMMEVLDTETALLFWDWSLTDTVARFDFDYEIYYSNSVYRGENGGRTAFTLSGNHNCLALIDLDPPQMRIPFFSPYTGEILNSPPWYSTRLMSVITPPGDQETGDVDGNGRTDIYDLLELLRALKDGSGEFRQSFDLDFNGKFDIFDLLALLKLLSN